MIKQIKYWIIRNIRSLNKLFKIEMVDWTPQLGDVYININMEKFEYVGNGYYRVLKH